jgi:hypothetical protein
MFVARESLLFPEKLRIAELASHQSLLWQEMQTRWKCEGRVGTASSAAHLLTAKLATGGVLLRADFAIPSRVLSN